MVLLHGFIKKTRKTPKEDLQLARGNKISMKGASDESKDERKDL